MGTWDGKAARSFEAGLAGKSVRWLGRAREPRATRTIFGGAAVLEATVPPLRITRGAAQQDAPGWHLTVHLAGKGRYRLDGGWVEQRPGAVVLLDARAPCAVEHPDGAHVVSWYIPHAQIAPFSSNRWGPLEEVAGGVGSVMADHAVALARAGAQIGPSAAEGLVAHLAALAGLAVATGRADDVRARPGHLALLRHRILGLVEARFREPGFTAAAAARDLRISRRWLHAVLHRGGIGFAERVRERRLRESLRLLRDRSADHLSVTEIAFGAGFNDLSTFCRQFRSRYGLTPRQARAGDGMNGRPA